jgi:hypothetical protein
MVFGVQDALEYLDLAALADPDDQLAARALDECRDELDRAEMWGR